MSKPRVTCKPGNGGHNKTSISRFRLIEPIDDNIDTTTGLYHSSKRKQYGYFEDIELHISFGSQLPLDRPGGVLIVSKPTTQLLRQLFSNRSQRTGNIKKDGRRYIPRR